MVEENREIVLNVLEQKILYEFQDRSLLVQALTHSSARDNEYTHNERMEFLGDSIVGFAVSEYLYQTFPDYEEGGLASLKSVLVSSKVMRELAVEIGIDQSLILGHEFRDGRNIPGSIISDAFEAITAAIYLDGGYEHAARFVVGLMKTKMEKVKSHYYALNYKSMLQGYAQKHFFQVPVYHVVSEEGPDHEKRFEVVVELDAHRYPPSWGKSKKEAEQGAAKHALDTLQSDT